MRRGGGGGVRAFLVTSVWLAGQMPPGERGGVGSPSKGLLRTACHVVVTGLWQSLCDAGPAQVTSCSSMKQNKGRIALVWIAPVQTFPIAVELELGCTRQRPT